MKWQTLDTGEPEEWHNALRRIPTTDTYFLPEYHRAYELNGDGVAHAFLAEDGDDLLFYPYFVRPIERVGSEPVGEPWFDIQTVYGYSGPLCTTNDTAFLARAWAAFADWCQRERIIAEFVRFNPLIENYQYVNGSCRVDLDRETVVVPLECSEEQLWTSYPRVHRNMVRKALSNGLVCEEVHAVEGLSVLRRLYDEMMDRVGASRYYYFSDGYFDYLCNALGEKVKLFTVRDGDQTAAAALFLAHGYTIHAHLGGHDIRYSGAAPTNLLYHTVAEWGRQRGFRWLNMGGGRTPDPNDSLFKFKASLSRSRAPFYIGKRVHNPETYEQLCTLWMEQRGVSERPSYFLLYRLGMDN